MMNILSSVACHDPAGNYSKFWMGEIGTFSGVLITFRGGLLCGDRVFRYLCIVAICPKSEGKNRMPGGLF